MIEYRLFNRKDLQQFIGSAEFRALKTTPISKHRAVSHIKNPRALDDDVLLIVAYSGSEIVGYFGTIPDIVFIHGKAYKCAVISCIWVRPDLRKGDVSIHLLKKSHECYELIFGSDYVPKTIKMYNRSGFFTQELKLDGVRMYMRMDLHTILPPKKKLFRKIKSLLHLGDEIVNSVLDFRFALYGRRIKPGNFEYIKEVDDEAAAFLEKLQDKQLFQRGQEELNWIIHHPWILTDPSDHDPRYYFTSYDRSFEFHCLKLRNDYGDLISFMILSRRNQVLKIPYCYLQPSALEAVGKVIIHHIYKWKINTFVTHHPQLTPYFLQHGFRQIFRKKTSRLYLFSKELYPMLSGYDFELQDGDADAVFI